MTQAELATQSGVPVCDISSIESGSAGNVKVDRVRGAFSAMGAQARLTAWWNGASADRLLDEKHARLVERALSAFTRRGWQTAVEVSFNEYGDRGSIDILAGIESHAAVAVGEVKSTFGSLEETNRALDVKERHAAKIARARFGWQASIVARLLILPDDRTIRRLIADHEHTMAAAYPARSREVRAWLRAPNRPLRGIWFLSDLPISPAVPREDPQVRTERPLVDDLSEATSNRLERTAYFADLTGDDD